jgi:hypothetical protein
MRRSIQVGEFRSSRLSLGRCYVYVLPCADEDILKLGFSRDPVARLQALHRRYFALFDLERAWLIETETVRDARKLELELGRSIVVHSAPAPLVIRRQAAGHTEWYRGAYAQLDQATAALRSRGFVVHAPAAPWVREYLVARGDTLFTWAGQMLQAIEWASQSGYDTDKMQSTLQDALDAYDALAIDLKSLLQPAVWDWYRPR